MSFALQQQIVGFIDETDRFSIDVQFDSSLLLLELLLETSTRIVEKLTVMKTVRRS